jgi:hypothetical protein
MCEKKGHMPTLPIQKQYMFLSAVHISCAETIQFHLRSPSSSRKQKSCVQKHEERGGWKVVPHLQQAACMAGIDVENGRQLVDSFLLLRVHAFAVCVAAAVLCANLKIRKKLANTSSSSFVECVCY